MTDRTYQSAIVGNQESSSDRATQTSNMSNARVDSFMAEKNGGGDPVTALAYRGESSESSTAQRINVVRQEVDANLTTLKKKNKTKTK